MAWSFYLPVNCQLLNCAQYGLMAVGAYASALLILAGVPFYPSILVAGFIASLFSMLLGFLGLRLKGLGVVIVTIAYAEIIKVFLNNADIFIPAAGGAAGLFVPAKTNVWNALAAFLLTGTLMYLLQKSRFGRAVKAVGCDEVAAESIGINKTFVKLFLMMGSGFMSGIAGSLLGHYTGYIEPDMFNFSLLVEAAAFAVVGGIGTMWGCVVGVILIDTLLDSLTFLVGWRVFSYGALIVLIMLFRPSGIVTGKLLQNGLEVVTGKLKGSTLENQRG
jgi:branched-chain amino acid transport system permease protein